MPKISQLINLVFSLKLHFQNELNEIIEEFEISNSEKSNFTFWSELILIKNKLSILFLLVPKRFFKSSVFVSILLFLNLWFMFGKTGQIDHPIPVQIDHQFRSKLTTTFQFKLTT